MSYVLVGAPLPAWKLLTKKLTNPLIFIKWAEKIEHRKAEREDSEVISEYRE